MLIVMPFSVADLDILKGGFKYYRVRSMPEILALPRPPPVTCYVASRARLKINKEGSSHDH